MTNPDLDRNRTHREAARSNTSMGSSFSPLVIGAAAVIVALVAFLMFADSGTNQTAEFNTNPPASSTPAPLPDRGPSVVPGNPPAAEPATPSNPETPPAQQ